MSEHDTESQSKYSGSIFGLIWRWRALIGAGVIVITAIFAGRMAWEQQRERVVRNADSLLTADRIEVIGVPPWITTDLKWQALRNASLDMPLPLDAPDLETIARKSIRSRLMRPTLAKVLINPSHNSSTQAEPCCQSTPRSRACQAIRSRLSSTHTSDTSVNRTRTLSAIF